MRETDITGQTFNRLTAVRRLQGRHWLFRCSCGREKGIGKNHVTAGAIQSCGCAKTKTRSPREGLPEYHSWAGMKARCGNPANKKYPRYGGRGIRFDPRWVSFDEFVADMGPRPPGTTLGRIDNDGNYEPSNCRWETPKQQSNNRSSLISVEGGLSLKDRAAKIGVSYASLYYHIVIKGRSQADAERFLQGGRKCGNETFDGRSPRAGTGKKSRVTSDTAPTATGSVDHP